MKIAIDTRPLVSGDSVRGIGVYTRELLDAYGRLGFHDIRVLEDGFCQDSEKFDLVHFTAFNPFVVSVPLKKPQGTRFILTIYDLIPLIYPKHYPPGIKGSIKLALNKYLIKKNVDAILTISETSKKDICRFFGVNPGKVHVIYLAPRPVFRKLKIAKRYSLPNRFALYTGDINYNKNIPFLLEACKLAKIKLVIAGKQAKDIESMNLDHPELKHLKSLGWSGAMRLGFVPDEDLVGIYNLASVYVQPSLYEGFGLPVLEAFASGTPVVAAKTQALIEIGEGAALFADPENVNEFAEAIKSVINNKNVAMGLSKRGLAKAKKFSWEKTARETFKVYNSI